MYEILMGATSVIAGAIASIVGFGIGSILTPLLSLRIGLVYAALLILAGVSSLTSYSRKMRFGSKAAWIAGGISGVLGGLVGNQGGIRSTALLVHRELP